MDKDIQRILLSTNDLGEGIEGLAEHASPEQLAQLPQAFARNGCEGSSSC